MAKIIALHALTMPHPTQASYTSIPPRGPAHIPIPARVIHILIAAEFFDILYLYKWALIQKARGEMIWIESVNCS